MGTSRRCPLHFSRHIIVVCCCWSLALGKRAYPMGCLQKDPSYYDYDSCPLPVPNIPVRSPNDFHLLRRLGAGRFSDVFEAIDLVMLNDVSESSALSIRNHNPLVVVKVSQIKIVSLLLKELHSAQIANQSLLNSLPKKEAETNFGEKSEARVTGSFPCL